MKVCFTPLAVSDVSKIYDHIAQISKTSAQRVEDAIRKACRSLGDFPEIG